MMNTILENFALEEKRHATAAPERLGINLLSDARADHARHARVSPPHTDQSMLNMPSTSTALTSSEESLVVDYRGDQTPSQKVDEKLLHALGGFHAGPSQHSNRLSNRFRRHQGQ